MNSARTPHYRVMPKAGGRWAICYPLAGGAGLAEHCDCLTAGAAESEAAWLNAERDREQRLAAGWHHEDAQPGALAA